MGKSQELTASFHATCSHFLDMLLLQNHDQSSTSNTDLDHVLRAIDRLFRLVPGLHDQRAEFKRLSSGRTKEQRTKRDLLQLIEQAISRSLDNQRAHHEYASLEEDKDILIQEFIHTADLLAKSLERSEYKDQRFLFMEVEFDQLECSSQEREEELQHFVNCIYDLSKPELNDQRASLGLS